MKKCIRAMTLTLLFPLGALAQPTPTPTVTPTVPPDVTETAVATPTVVPTGTPLSCVSEAPYLACVDACNVADPACGSSGAVHAFVLFLEASLADCSYPGVASGDRLNGLKMVLQGLRKTGAIDGTQWVTLSKEINACRKLLKKPRPTPSPEAEGPEHGAPGGHKGRGRGHGKGHH